MKLILLVAFMSLCACAQGILVTDIGGTHQASACPSQTGSSPNLWTGYDFHGKCATNSAFLLPYSDCTHITLQNIILCGGGGHSDYYGNELYALDYHSATAGWRRISNPSQWCGNGSSFTNDTGPGCGTQGLSPTYGGIFSSACNAISAPKDCFENEDNTPVSFHMFGGVTYVQSLNSVYFNINAVNASGAAGTGTGFTWLFTCTGAWVLGNCSWSGQDPVAGQSPLNFGSASSSGQVVRYDPVTNNVFTGKITNGQFFKWVPGTNTSTYIGTITPTTFGATSRVIDPLHHTMWFLGAKAASTAFDAAYITLNGTNNWTDVSSTLLPTCGGLFAATYGWPGLEWDPITSKIIGFAPFADATKLIVFDPVAMQCETRNLSSPVGTTIPSWPSGATQNGVFSKLLYTPDVPGQMIYIPPNANIDAFSIQVDPTPGMGHSTTTCYDWDGDGYGPGCAAGPDADDSDPTVYSAPQAIAKWGTMAAFLAYRQYSPAHIWYVAPASPTARCLANGGSSGACTGSDSNSCEDSVTTPCLTWAHIQAAARTAAASGSVMVMMRDNWGDNVYNTPSGAPGAPVIFLGYPGELPVFDPGVVAGAQINAVDVSWIVVDGVKTVGSAGIAGGSTASSGNTTFHDNVFRNLEGTGAGGISGAGSFQAFNGLVNITLENSVFHDAGVSGQHLVYMGSRTLASSNVRARNLILYNSNDYPGFQFNGRLTDGFFENMNIYSSPSSAGFSIENGVSKSFIRDIVTYNSGSGIQITNYDGDCYVGSATTGICPYDQTGNVFQNNTAYVGSLDSAGASTVNSALIVLNLTTGCPPAWSSGKSYTAGAQVLYPYGATGGTVYTSIAGGNLGNTPPSAQWTTGAGCAMAKQGNLGGNTYKNNIFVSNSSNTANYPPVIFPMCTIATYLPGGGSCALDNSETTLATSVFVNNDFQTTGGYTGADVVGTGPNPGFGYTGHAFTALNAGLWNASSAGNIQGNPLFAAADPAAYYLTPAAFNFQIQSASPAFGAGTIAAATGPTVDSVGTAFSVSAPNIGALSGAFDGPTITTKSLPNGSILRPYSATISTTGSPTCSITVGGFPGVTLSSSCVFSGTPTTPGINSFTVTATNGAGSANQSYSIKVIGSGPSSIKRGP
jgi:hypothetical protein